MITIPVSVIIPAFNRSELLPRALASVEAQLPWRPAEVIVVDDHSSDNSAEVAERLGATVIRHPENRGEAAARNTAVSHASGEWLALLDSDDEWLPGHLERLWLARAAHVLVADSALTQGGGPPRLFGHPSREPVRLASPRPLMFPENFIPACASMVRRDALLEAGGFRALPFGADLDVWIRVLEQGSGVMLPEPGAWYHIHTQQVTVDKQGLWAGRESVWEHYRDRPWYSALAARKLRSATHWDSRPGNRAAAMPVWPWVKAALGDPWRLAGVPELLAWRRRKRRRTEAALEHLRPALAPETLV
jgi:glycosyltransferase involved in cell wall biosynthesis